MFGLDMLDVGFLIYLVGGLGQGSDGLDSSCLVLIERDTVGKDIRTTRLD